MKSIFFHSLIVLISILIPSPAFCQKTLVSTGSHQVRVEHNQTKAEAREIAREKAIINAIENAFGTYVEGLADMTMKDGRDYFVYYGSAKVKGDWIEPLDEKYIEEPQWIETKEGKELITWITCEVKGKVREASTPKAMIEYETLNCPDIRCRTGEFLSGERFYLYFRSPVDGYLSVFIEDEEAVFRCFPYLSMKGEQLSAVKVEPDVRYILFSEDQKDNLFNLPVDKPELYTKRELEYNNVYIVFSEIPYLKPVLGNEKQFDDQSGYVIPRSLSKKDFNRWLSENRAKNPGFLDVKKRVKIRDNK